MPINDLPPAGQPKPAPPPPPPPKKGRFKVVSDASRACATTVTDAATGQPICAYAVEFQHDVRHGGRPELTIKTYQQDFEYEGPGTLFVACPKCKAEMKPPTGIGLIGQAGVQPSGTVKTYIRPEDQVPRKPTGTGVIGQTGNKPGGSYEGMTKPPREGLYDPRPISGPEIERHSEISGFAVCAAIGVSFAAIIIVFILAILGKVL